MVPFAGWHDRNRLRTTGRAVWISKAGVLAATFVCLTGASEKGRLAVLVDEPPPTALRWATILGPPLSNIMKS